jgi:hypothetical protein
VNQHFFSNTIPTESLTLEQAPRENDGWDQIEWFALTFHPNEAENFAYPKKSVLQLLKENPEMSLKELRFLLFFEQRRWNHIGKVPNTEAMSGIREIVIRIRSKLK